MSSRNDDRWADSDLILKAPPAQEDPLYRKTLLTIIQQQIDKHPRSSQAQIGPSEAADCPTKIAFKLTYGGASDREGGWAAHKGTVLHAWLDDTFKESDRTMPDGSPRFLSDLKLDPVSEHVNGGTLDLYDRMEQFVIDHKLPGDWTIKHVRNGEISGTYYGQLLLYGLGLEEMGYPISKVGILYMPMCGDDLHGPNRGAIFRFWPYDRATALKIINNIDRIKGIVEVGGIVKAMEILPKKSSFCSSCPAFVGSGDRRATCPGVQAPSSRGANSIDPKNPFARGN